MMAGTDTAAAPIQVLGLDVVQAELERAADIDIGDLPKDMNRSGNMDLPSADLGEKEIQLPNAKTVKYEPTIADTNPDHYFALLSHEQWSGDQDFKTGYVPVKKAHGLNIPARHFGPDEMIRRGQHVLYVATKAYAAAHKAKYRKKMDQSVGAFRPDVVQDEQRAGDGLQGSVVSSGENTELDAVDMKAIHTAGSKNKK